MIDFMAHEIQDHRAGRMLAALIGSDNSRAKVTLTTDLFDAAGTRKWHQTFNLKGWNGRDGGRMISVEIAGTGSYESGERPAVAFYLDIANLKIKGSRTAISNPLLRYAAEAAVAYAWLGEVGMPQPTNGRVVVVESENCGHCGLPLSDPVSIERGIGPTCLGRATGTKTIFGRS